MVLLQGRVELFYSGYYCKCKWLQHQRWQNAKSVTWWIYSSEADSVVNMTQTSSIIKVLITQGLIKNVITDCLRATADLLPQLVNILIIWPPATKAVFMEADLQPDKDTSLLDQPGHTRSSPSSKEPEQHIAKSWQSARLLLCNYEGLVLEVSLNKVLWNRRREEGDRLCNPAPLITVPNHPKQN